MVDASTTYLAISIARKLYREREGAGAAVGIIRRRYQLQGKAKVAEVAGAVSRIRFVHDGLAGR